MTTVEMHRARKGSFGNGLIVRGFVRETVRHANMPETAARGCSFGLGWGVKGLVCQNGWTRYETPITGDEA
ncbi:MAG: hypothetical protein HQM00_03080 [Magnetococcales bacterium]|nr:hypothetical protein [Magnetococcales bacterium]